MKLSNIITLLIAAIFFTGCASNTTSTSEEVAPETGAATMDSQAAPAKTAYEGSTGSGLLMERYKAGSIEGYRD
jgi:PBP1b-binding outer membrane lipoprotein LpoB